MRLAPSLSGVKKRYIRSNPEQHKLALAVVLSEHFRQPYLPLASACTMSEIPKAPGILFANISFPPEVRTPDLPDFLHYQPFIEQATRVHRFAHERTKQDLAAARKRARSRGA